MVIVKVIVPVLSKGMELVVKDFDKLGGATTVVKSPCSLPVPPLIEVILLFGICLNPAVVPDKAKLKKHVPFGGRIPSVSAIEFGAVVMSVPLHTEMEAVSTARPSGRITVKATSNRVVLSL